MIYDRQFCENCMSLILYNEYTGEFVIFTLESCINVVQYVVSILVHDSIACPIHPTHNVMVSKYNKSSSLSLYFHC